MRDKILSIQSKLVYGYVGNNIAELAIQLHGLDVIALPTVYLSAHTGHQPVYGARIEKKLFDDLITGIKNLDILGQVAHMVTGYIGAEEIVDSTANLISEIKSKNADRLYICDPVMGDDEGLYIAEDLAQKIIAKLLPLCDIMTPNHFEFEYIIGKKARSVDEILEAVSTHPILKNKTIIITSCDLDNTPEGKIQSLIVTEGEYHSILSDKVDMVTTGTGDLFAAVTTSQLAMGRGIVLSATTAAQVVTQALSYTAKHGNAEMNAKSILQSVLSSQK